MGGVLRRTDRPAEIYFYEWSVNRWRSSETRTILSLAGRGLYRELLDLCYTQGSISADFQILASQVGCAPVEIDQIWPLIRRHFHHDPHDKSRLRNKVADVYRKQYLDYISAQKVSGRVGGKRKANKMMKMSRGTASLEENRIEENRILQQQAQFGDWPETAKAVHEQFPDCEGSFIETLARASAQKFAGVTNPKCAFSDALLAEAVHRVYKPGQRTAGLFSRTVPACIQTWAIEGRPEENPNEEVHY